MASLAGHYVRLGLRPPPPGHSRAAVAAAYRAAALRAHPDRGGSAAEFAALTASYEAVLGGAPVYAPASMRSHGTHDRSGASVLLALLVPAVVAAGVAARAVLSAKADRPGLRAGGTSRFAPHNPPAAAQRPAPRPPADPARS